MGYIQQGKGGKGAQARLSHGGGRSNKQGGRWSGLSGTGEEIHGRRRHGAAAAASCWSDDSVGYRVAVIECAIRDTMRDASCQCEWIDASSSRSR